MKELGDLSCQGPTIYMSGGRLLILGCGVANSNNYDKVFEFRKNSGEAFNAEEVFITPSTYRAFSDQPWELLPNVFIRGFKNNVQKGEIHLTNLVHAQVYRIDFSTYSGFDDIDMLYFFVDNQDLFVDDLTLSPVSVAPVLPTLTTAAASGIQSDQALLGGSISNDGGAPVTSRGVVWSTTTNPTITSNRVNIGTGTGSFSSTVTGLPASSTIYARAFAINSAGTAYGNQISFTTPARLVASILSITDESCLGNDGSVFLGASGGRAPYSFRWLFDNSTLSSRTDLSAGTYTIRVTDAAGEVATAIAVVGSQDPLNLTLTTGNVSCNNGNDGFASLVVSGGSGTYSYSWSVGGQTGTRIENLAAGTYSVTVTDQSGCQAIRNFTISQPAPLTATPGAISQVSCIGGNDGSLQIIASGGTPPYTYAWDQPFGNTANLFNLRAGTYRVTVTDSKLCTVSQEVIIAEPSMPLIVTTNPASNVLSTTATVSGNAVIDNSGNGESTTCIVRAGFVYGTTPNPDINTGTVQQVNPFNLAGYSANLVNLRPNAQYFVRSFVENSFGRITYGNEQSFTTQAITLSISGSFSVRPKNYDGNLSAEINGYFLTLSGLVSPFNSVTLENVVVEFESAEAGINKPVRIVSANITGPDAGSYNLSLVNSPLGSGTVFKLSVSISGLQAESKTYDGSTDATVIGTPLLNGIINGDEVFLSGTPQFDFLSSNAGNNLEINATGFLLIGSDAANYELFPPVWFANIFKRQLLIEDPSIVKQKVYDGTPTASFTLGNPINVVSGDDLTVFGSASFEDSNAGIGKRISLIYTLSGNDAVNYLVPEAFSITDGEITPKGLTVTVSSETKEFGENDPLFSLSYAGFVSGENESIVSGTPSFSRNPGENVGIYPVTVSGLSTSNYELSVISGSLEITKRRIQINFSFLSKYYGDLDPVLSFTSSPELGSVLPNGLRVELLGSPQRIPGEDIGDYIIDIGTLIDANPNYLIGYVGGLLSILPKPVQVTADSKSKIFGELDPALTYTSVPAVGDRLPNGIEVSFTGSIVRDPGESVGNYAIRQGTLSNPNFSIDFTEGQLEIRALQVQIIADQQRKTYGDLDPVLSYQSIPVLGTQLENGEILTLTGELLRESGENVGQYAINQGTLSNPNVSLVFTGANLEITPRTIRVSANPASKVYGDLDPILSFQSVPELNQILPNGQAVSLTGSLSREPGENVGQYRILQGSLENSNYTIEYTENQFEILPLEVLVRADSKKKTFGQVDPTLSYSAVPALGSTLPNGIVLEFQGELERAPGEDVGLYPINQGTLNNSNLRISYEPGTLEILPLEVQVLADPKVKTYGDLDPELTFRSIPALNSSLENGLKVSFTGSLNRQTGETVGNYTISQGTLSNPNFTVVYTSNVLEIRPLAVRVVLEDKQKIFGDLDPVLTYTSVPAVGEKLPNGILVSLSGSPIREQGENIGTYKITSGSLANPNYILEFEDGTLTIVPFKVQVSALPAGKIYGQMDPFLAFNVSPQSGTILPNGAVISLGGSLSRTPGENVGVYSIVQGTLAGSNFSIEFKGADFTISPKALEVIPSPNQSKIYGSADPVFTYQIRGWERNDNPSLLSGAISRESGEDSGRYRFNLGNLSAGKNYQLVIGEEYFTVLPKSLLIRAENKSKIYGDPNPQLTYVFEGLANGDVSIDQVPLISTTADERSPVGSYPITLSGGVDKNYQIALQNSTLTVTAKPLRVTAQDKTMLYGGPLPTLTYVYEGLVNGEIGLETEPTIKTLATSASDVGVYAISIEGGIGSNYLISYQSGKLTVQPRELRIVADSKTRSYGDNNPDLTYSLVGLVNGDIGLKEAPLLQTPANQSSGVGTYPILVSGGVDSNYSLIYQNGTLEVNPSVLLVSALPSSKIFGQADPELRFQVQGFKLQDGLELGEGLLVRDPGEAVGSYDIKQGSLEFGLNYTINFTKGKFDILPAEVVSVTPPTLIQTPWGISPDLPSTLTVLTQGGMEFTLGVSWNSLPLNVFARGLYILSGELILSSGIKNSALIPAQIQVLVLAKPAPQDLILSNNRFVPDPDNFFQVIGNFSVIDPIDDVHSIELVQREMDNYLFEIKEGILFWSSANQEEGRSQFTIKVQVTDRDGNTLLKEFTIIRDRIDLNNLVVYNSFSPNGDGVNDTWGVPDLRYYKNVRVHIFNREGRRVFYTEDPDFRWDGSFQGVDLATDSFQWVIEILETGEKRNGVLNLIR
ncbi:MBG domain-containing protein [Algoriphagus confluentis]